MPFAGPETTLAATILDAARGDASEREFALWRSPQLCSTTFQQLARRLNDFRENIPGTTYAQDHFDIVLAPLTHPLRFVAGHQNAGQPARTECRRRQPGR